MKSVLFDKSEKVVIEHPELVPADFLSLSEKAEELSDGPEIDVKTRDTARQEEEESHDIGEVLEHERVLTTDPYVLQEHLQIDLRGVIDSEEQSKVDGPELVGVSMVVKDDHVSDDQFKSRRSTQKGLVKMP